MTEEKPEESDPLGSALVLCCADICSIAIMWPSPRVRPRSIQTRTPGMWTASNVPLWKAAKVPTVCGNNANTPAKQFVFYLTVHLRLAADQLNHTRFLTSAADLSIKTPRLTSPARFEWAAARAPQFRRLFPSNRSLWGHRCDSSWA